jgi:hypothetical protein
MRTADPTGWLDNSARSGRGGGPEPAAGKLRLAAMAIANVATGACCTV